MAKYRLSHVTNSSSSSFICRICGEVETGYDAGYSDFDMVKCEAGHVFHESCGDINSVDFKEVLKSVLVYNQDSDECKEMLENLDNGKYDNDECKEILFDEFEGRHYFPTQGCPVCNLKVLSNDDILSYIMKSENLTESEILEDIRKVFKNYEELSTYLKSK